MIEKLAIANRGEIALRIQRTCREMGINTVALHSEADKNAKYVMLAEESVCIGPAQVSESYLNIPAVIAAAEVSGASAIHPGYGFLAENGDFAERVEESGFIFVGPRPETIRLMGEKISAIQTMNRAGIPCVPGSDGMLPVSSQEIHALANKIGYPIMVKANKGGGGRGIRTVYSSDTLDKAIALTQAEAKAAFADDTVYIEKYFTSPRHIEVQVLADSFANAIHLGTRDCTVQRRHQKVIEEAPAFGISQELKDEIGRLCVHACREINYRGVGTFEFVYQDGDLYFIEMNTRLQVEHPVTEEITGIDLVQQQIKVAQGERLQIRQEDLSFQGCAIECRINAEDPFTFAPSPGRIENFHPPGGLGIRFDSHIYNQYSISPFYDSLVAKVIARGATRSEAINRMRRALTEMVIAGIKTNIPLHREILHDGLFEKGEVDTHYLDKLLAFRL